MERVGTGIIELESIGIGGSGCPYPPWKLRNIRNSRNRACAGTFLVVILLTGDKRGENL